MVSNLWISSADSLVPVRSRATDYKALVCVFLYGGVDGNNVVIPAGCGGVGGQYAAVRSAASGINIPLAGRHSNVIQTAFCSSAPYGLHPAMA